MKLTITRLVTFLSLCCIAATNLPPRAWLPIVSQRPFALSVCPAGVWVLNDFNSYVDSGNYVHIVGEVCNNTARAVELFKVAFDFYNAAGGLIDTAYTYTDPTILPAGTRTCYDVSLPVPAGWATYSYDSGSYWTTTAGTPKLTLTSSSGAYDPTYGWYNVLGMIRNDDTITATYVEPVVTLFNSSARVIGCGSTFVNSTDLVPGQASAFKTYSTGRDYSDVYVYTVLVGGQFPSAAASVQAGPPEPLRVASRSAQSGNTP